jgi:hypothetical protein
MANRFTTHILKNSDIVNRTLPSTLFKGEPIVNTADGILYFSGITTSTNEWTPAGTGTTSNFFEVGSNLYDLRLRNRITKYEGTSGAGLNGKFLSGTTNGFILADISSISSVDTYTTGFTYTPSTNTFTIKRNLGQIDLTAQFNSVSGFTVSNLTSGRIVYVGSGGLLTDKVGFTFDNATNTLSVPSDGSVNVGTGGLNVSGNTIIQGSLTVFGSSVSAFTSDLYVEDPNITLNYNPTGNTIVTSIGSGLSVQDGNGVTGGTVNFNINRLDSLTGITASNIPNITEYSSSTGYANRGWITQLNDIVIRSTNINTPNGVRVLAEFDILDGGAY